MKHLELDFESERERMDAWCRLSEGARDLLLALTPGQAMASEPFGAEITEITRLGLVTHLVGTPRVRIATEGAGWLRALRSLARVQRQPGQSQEDFVRRYLHEHFTVEERDALPAAGGGFYSRADDLTITIVNSATHIRCFQALTNGVAWEAARRPKHWRTEGPGNEALLGSKATLSATQALLKSLLEKDEPVAWHELADLLPRANRTHVWSALRVLLRHLLAFGVWSSEKRLPQIEVLPHVRTRLRRPPAKVPPVEEAPAVSSIADLPSEIAAL